MPLKGRKKEESPSNKTSEPRQNPAVNAKIDAYMEKHPKLVEKLNSYDKDRLVRMHVLNHVEREESINKSIQNDWKNNPEKKAALETLVSHMPKEKQADAMIALARQAKVQENKAKYAENQNNSAKQEAPKKGVSV